MNLVPRDGVLVGFRPENLLPARVLTGTDAVTVKLAVDRVEYLSGDRHVYGTAHGIGEPTRVVARLPATVDAPVTAGEDQQFEVSGRRLRFFATDTGRRTERVPL
jgi:multiple sugar transport system ATP-binding protein